MKHSSSRARGTDIPRLRIWLQSAVSVAQIADVVPRPAIRSGPSRLGNPVDDEELHHAHDPCRVPDPDSHLSTFRHANHVRTADQVGPDSGTPGSPREQGGAGPTAAGNRSSRNEARALHCGRTPVNGYVLPRTARLSGSDREGDGKIESWGRPSSERQGVWPYTGPLHDAEFDHLVSSELGGDSDSACVPHSGAPGSFGGRLAAARSPGRLGVSADHAVC